VRAEEWVRCVFFWGIGMALHWMSPSPLALAATSIRAESMDAPREEPVLRTGLRAGVLPVPLQWTLQWNSGAQFDHSELASGFVYFLQSDLFAVPAFGSIQTSFLQWDGTWGVEHSSGLVLQLGVRHYRAGGSLQGFQDDQGQPFLDRLEAQAWSASLGMHYRWSWSWGPHREWRIRTGVGVQVPVWGTLLIQTQDLEGQTETVRPGTLSRIIKLPLPEVLLFELTRSWD